MVSKQELRDSLSEHKRILAAHRKFFVWMLECYRFCNDGEDDQMRLALDVIKEDYGIQYTTNDALKAYRYLSKEYAKYLKSEEERKNVL